MTGHETRRAARGPAPNFYAGAVRDPEALWDAMRVEGVDDEIAALRAELRSELRDKPDSYDLMLKSVALIVRAVAAKHRMSPRNAEDFAARMTSILRDLGEQMAPELFGGTNDV